MVTAANFAVLIGITAIAASVLSLAVRQMRAAWLWLDGSGLLLAGAGYLVRGTSATGPSWQVGFGLFMAIGGTLGLTGAYLSRKTTRKSGQS